jgi:hypothetical protein
MPKITEMRSRMVSHLARVSGKAIEREFKRIDALRWSGKISPVTSDHMKQTAAIRLAWLANAA